MYYLKRFDQFTIFLVDQYYRVNLQQIVAPRLARLRRSNHRLVRIRVAKRKIIQFQTINQKIESIDARFATKLMLGQAL